MVNQVTLYSVDIFMIIVIIRIQIITIIIKIILIIKYIDIYTHAISLACALGFQCLGIVGLTRIPCLVTGVGSETPEVFTASLMVRKLQAQPATP